MATTRQTGLSDKVEKFLRKVVTEGVLFDPQVVELGFPRSSKSSISSSLTVLKNRGLIEVVGTKRRARVWRTLPKLYPRKGDAAAPPTTKIPEGHFSDAQLGQSILRIIRVQAAKIQELVAELRECKSDHSNMVEANKQLNEQSNILKNRINELANEKGGGYTSLHELQKLAMGGGKQ